MKKVLLSGAAMLIAVASFAQGNVATVAQVGNTNSNTAIQGGSSLSATISQVGALPANVASNTAITDQSGKGHSATINQNVNSTFNRAYSTQSNGSSATGANSSTVSQSNGSGGAAARGGARSVVTGDVGNFAGTFQVGGGNTAVVLQDGPSSKANLGEISQRGTSNTATTTQSDGAVSNVSQIFQGYNVLDVTGNKATVNQDKGQRNQSMVNQLSDNNTATVLQNVATSTGNVADVRQGDGMALTASGSNTATITQTGISTGNSASAIQTGKNGTVDIKQFNNAVGNIAFVNQVSGSGLKATGQQAYNASSRNQVRAIQYGTNSSVSWEQVVASDNKATFNQGAAGTTSANNKAYTYQKNGSQFGVITITQNGTANGGNNLAIVDQGFTAGVSSFSNVATITQEGSSNQARLRQTGAGSNTATIGQYGDFNVVSGPQVVTYPNGLGALQDGTGNKMTIMQTSTGAPATALLNNMASLSQTGMGNTISVTQTLTGTAMAGNMTTINQNGNGNVGSVTQTNGMTP